MLHYNILTRCSKPFQLLISSLFSAFNLVSEMQYFTSSIGLGPDMLKYMRLLDHACAKWFNHLVWSDSYSLDTFYCPQCTWKLNTHLCFFSFYNSCEQMHFEPSESDKQRCFAKLKRLCFPHQHSTS